MTKNLKAYRLWLASLGVFALAGATGAFMRFALLYGFPWGLQFANVRHAHSHLMYFGWVAPGLMALMVSWLPRLMKRPLSPRQIAQFRVNIIITLLLSLLAYAAFLPYGYSLASFGSVRLPAAVIASSLNIFAWYWFAWLYWRATKGVERGRPLRLWDAGLGFMILASMGAWGVAVASRLDVQDPFWNAALTHLFLDTVSDGWFVLTILGLAYAANPQAARHPLAARSESWLIVGLPVLFLLSVPINYVPIPVRLIGSAGGVSVALGLGGNIVALWSARPMGWRIQLLFLGLKGLATLAVVVPALSRWGDLMRLRVSYLHWLLLGFVTLGLIAAADDVWGRTAVPSRKWFAATVIAIIISLFFLTSLWPVAWSGRWVRVTAAWVALGPVLVALKALLQRLRRKT
ncbi:MAG: hypothetical protein GY803_11125 [Chloroflexi bacterium]|nr:hypothetical protein [Chloroflexota bacterium]